MNLSDTMSAARAHRHTSSSTKARANQQLVRRALEPKVCFAGCVMTPGNDALLCRCGKHSATFREGKKNQEANWSIWIQEEGPNKPRRLSTRSEKQKAWEAVSALCYGTYSALKPRAAAAAEQDADRTLRNSKRQHYDDTERRASRCCGPGESC